MKNVLPPVCLFLALVTMITGFALLAKGRPEAGMDLHRARVGTDDEYRQQLETQLRRQQRRHVLLLGGLFSSSMLFTVAAFLAMRPSAATARPRRT